MTHKQQQPSQHFWCSLLHSCPALLQGPTNLCTGSPRSCAQELITIFNDLELELLISGLPDIDVGDLRANTEYSGYTAAARVIQWFWECVDDMGKQDRALLVQFVTGTSKVPLDGFRGLQVRTPAVPSWIQHGSWGAWPLGGQ